jgi:hypothetical protein
MSYHVADNLTDIKPLARVMSDPSQCKGVCKAGICTITLKDAYCCYTELFEPTEVYAALLGHAHNSSTKHGGHANGVRVAQEHREASITGLQGEQRFRKHAKMGQQDYMYSEYSSKYPSGDALTGELDRDNGQQEYRDEMQQVYGDRPYDNARQQYYTDTDGHEYRDMGEQAYREDSYGNMGQQEHRDSNDGWQGYKEEPYNDMRELEYRSRGQPVLEDEGEQVYRDDAQWDTSEQANKEKEGLDYMENSSFFHGGEEKQAFKNKWDRRYHCWR